MLAAVRSRCSSLSSRFKPSVSPLLLDPSWKLGFIGSNRIFASSSSFSSEVGGPSDVSNIITLSEVEKILTDVKADNVKVISTQNQSIWADYMILATGRSDWHVRNIAQALVYKAKQKQRGAKQLILPTVQGYESKWIVIDYGKFVVHALDEKARDYFKLENLWTAETSDNEPSVQDLQNAFVKVRPKNNSKKKPAKVIA